MDSCDGGVDFGRRNFLDLIGYTGNIVLNPLKDLRPNRTVWRIHVKILHVYKYYSSNNSYSLELIFVDESGDKISASVKKEHVKKFESSLVLGTWKFISPMTVNAVTVTPD